MLMLSGVLFWVTSLNSALNELCLTLFNNTDMSRKQKVSTLSLKYLHWSHVMSYYSVSLNAFLQSNSWAAVQKFKLPKVNSLRTKRVMPERIQQFTSVLTDETALFSTFCIIFVASKPSFHYIRAPPHLHFKRITFFVGVNSLFAHMPASNQSTLTRRYFHRCAAENSSCAEQEKNNARAATVNRQTPGIVCDSEIKK